MIKTLDTLVQIDNHEEYAIYGMYYDADRDGNPLEGDYDDSYDYGHIVVETKRKRYIFRKVYSPIGWLPEITEYIAAHREDKDIYIDLNEFEKTSEGEYREFYCGDVIVEPL